VKGGVVIAWIRKINWGKALLVGLIYMVVATLVRQIEAMITMKYYLDPQYFGVWSKLMKPQAGPPPASFFITSLILTFGTGVSLAIVYYYMRAILPEKRKERIFYFADLMIGFNFIFFLLPTYLMFNVPTGLLISWFISSFIILVTAAYAIVKVIN
jgi:hypothetical protein